MASTTTKVADEFGPILSRHASDFALQYIYIDYANS